MSNWFKRHSRELRDYARAGMLLAVFSALVEFCYLDIAKRVAAHLQIADYVALSVLAVGALCAPLIFLPIDTRPRRTAFASTSILTLFTGLGFGFAVFAWTKSESASAVLLSAVLATIGWIITQRNAKRSARKQHTINVLLQQRSSEMLLFHSINIATYLRSGTDMSPADLLILDDKRRKWTPATSTAKDSYPVLASIAWTLNYYEFMALGVISGDLDDRLMRRSIRGMLCNTYIRFYPSIAESFGRSQPGSCPFENLQIIFEEWATDNERRQLKGRESEWQDHR